MNKILPVLKAGFVLCDHQQFLRHHPDIAKHAASKRRLNRSGSGANPALPKAQLVP
jgi:hypothetical protein